MKNWAYYLLFLGICALSLLAIQQDWLSFIGDKRLVSALLSEQSASGLMVIVISGALFTAIGGPRQIVALVLGYSLNWFYGTLLSTAIALLGATLCFYTARLLLRYSLKARFSRHLLKFNKLLRNNAVIKVCAVRLLPIGSNLMTNLIAGCSNVQFLPFLVGSGMGYLPQMLIFAMAGAGIGATDYYLFSLSIALFLIALVSSYYVKRLQSNRVSLIANSNSP